MRCVLVFAASAAVTAPIGACGMREEPVAAGCAVEPAAVERALLSVPNDVVLPGGARISQCVMRARSEAQLHDVGGLLTSVGDRLARRGARDRRAALGLGYLIGATRRGAARAEGVQAELVHRLERSAAELERAGGAARAALRRGISAGERSG